LANWKELRKKVILDTIVGKDHTGTLQTIVDTINSFFQDQLDNPGELLVE